MMLRFAHLGNAEQVQYTQMAATAAGGALTAATSAHLLAAGVAGPIGLAVAGVAMALSAIFSRKGPQQKVISTHIVDELEPQLKANVDGYLAGPRTRSSQAAALANFDAAWAYLSSSQACGSAELGNPGKACIRDRSRGGKWDWFSYYRDPIANDTEVQDDPVADALSMVLPGLDADGFSKYLLPAGLILLGVLL